MNIVHWINAGLNNYLAISARHHCENNERQPIRYGKVFPQIEYGCEATTEWKIKPQKQSAYVMQLMV